MLTKVSYSMVESAPVNVLDYGADPTGVAECSTQINAAMTAANALGTSVYMPAGDYKISTSITPAKAGVTGAGASGTTIHCDSCAAFLFPNAYVSPRQACVIEKLSISSISSSCDSVYAFYAPGVASGAAPVYNSGITVMDVTVNNRFGGGFYFKDCFEVNVDRVIMTDVGRPVFLSGSVVQSYFSRISAFADNAPSSPLGNCGFATEIATYAAGQLTPEHITTTDCSWIGYDVGVTHEAGLMISFVNTDVQTKTYGMLLNGPCVVSGGIIGSLGTDTAGWIGIYMQPFDFEMANAIFIENVSINPLVSPSVPATSYGIKVGDNTAEKYSVVVDSCSFIGGSSWLKHAVFSENSRGLTITNCRFNTSISISQDILLNSAYFASVTANMFGSNGTIEVNNGSGGGDAGTITGNHINGGSVTLTTGSPANWLNQNNV